MPKTEGKKIAIVSNKFHDAAVEVCEHYFKGLYDMVVGESETVRRKPHPDGIFKILETFGIEKNMLLCSVIQKSISRQVPMPE